MGTVVPEDFCQCLLHSQCQILTWHCAFSLCPSPKTRCYLLFSAYWPHGGVQQGEEILCWSDLASVSRHYILHSGWRIISVLFPLPIFCTQRGCFSVPSLQLQRSGTRARRWQCLLSSPQHGRVLFPRGDNQIDSREALCITSNHFYLYPSGLIHGVFFLRSLVLPSCLYEHPAGSMEKSPEW